MDEILNAIYQENPDSLLDLVNYHEPLRAIVIEWYERTMPYHPDDCGIMFFIMYPTRYSKNSKDSE